MPGHVAPSVAHQTQEPEVLGSVPGSATLFFSPSTNSRGAFVSYWQKFVHSVLVNSLGGLSLPRNKVVRLTDHPNMTIAV